MPQKKKSRHILGAHTSVAGGIPSAVDLARNLGFDTMQIFTKNSNRWYSDPISEEQKEIYKNKLSETNIGPVIAHDSYLINLCAADKELLQKSRDAFYDELNRCEQLGIEYLNFHPGSAKGQAEDDALKLAAESLNILHSRTAGFSVKSMIELTAGQGSAIGCKFEHIHRIYELVEEKDRISVCIDTAHIFAAGYDLRSEKAYEKTMQQFDEIIGLELLKCIHVNDSKKELGSRVDRHEHIGEGYIGLEGFSNIMNDKRLTGIPMILETPKTKGQPEDLVNIEKLVELIDS